MPRPEDEPAILIFVDILGFGDLTNQYRVRVEDCVENYRGKEYSGSRTTEIQRQINCFNRIISSGVSAATALFGTQAMLFSDCAFLVFTKDNLDDRPAVRTGMVATDLMRKFIKNLIPVRMGIGKGTFYDLEYLTTTNGKLITSKSRFIGTAVTCAHDAAERCEGKGLRIFVHESAEEDLPRMGGSLKVPQTLKSVKWELDYLYDPQPIGKQEQLERDDRELFDNVASMNTPDLSESARLHYTETLAALNRMRISNSRKAFAL
jgi:hypothetical protein